MEVVKEYHDDRSCVARIQRLPGIFYKSVILLLITPIVVFIVAINLQRIWENGSILFSFPPSTHNSKRNAFNKLLNVTLTSRLVNKHYMTRSIPKRLCKVQNV